MKDERAECLFDDLAERIVDEIIDVLLKKIKDFKRQYMSEPEYVVLPKWIKSILKTSNVLILTTNETQNRKELLCGMIPIFTKSKSYLYEIEVI